MLASRQRPSALEHQDPPPVPARETPRTDDSRGGWLGGTSWAARSRPCAYFNQRDHRLLDRQLLPDLLRPLMQASVRTSPAPMPREDQLTRLLNLCQSELERKWARMVDRMGLKLPSDAQRLVESCGVRPDFLYRDEGVAIFIDGPPHDTPEQRAKDDEQQDALEDHGLTVIRFHHTEEWEPILRRYPTLFGTPAAASEPAPAPSSGDGFDPEDSR